MADQQRRQRSARHDAPDLDDLIARLAQRRQPPSDEPTSRVTVRIPKDRADHLKALAKEMGEKFPDVVSAMFEEGCSKLLKAEAKLPRVDAK